MNTTRRALLSSTAGSVLASTAGCLGTFVGTPQATTRLTELTYHNQTDERHTLRIEVSTDGGNDTLVERTVDLAPASSDGDEDGGTTAAASGTIGDALPDERGSFTVFATLVDENARSADSERTQKFRVPFFDRRRECSRVELRVEPGADLESGIQNGCENE
ncbi:hypothetical protein [Haloarchaeobius sp. DFWS5]|uniref:hypothetical protein n=1 Tax=Haloarchaeobius sp. DFWS5 TaxID=3446114 RepID=UPI003EBFEAAE